MGAVRKINQHLPDCPDYLLLFQEHPERCLNPAKEFERYRIEDNSAVARAEQRGTRLAARFAHINEQQHRAGERWRRPPDILD